MERLLTVQVECLDSGTTLKVVLLEHVEVGFTENFVSTKHRVTRPTMFACPGHARRVPGQTCEVISR
jgi:hypothetical protein